MYRQAQRDKFVMTSLRTVMGTRTPAHLHFLHCLERGELPPLPGSASGHIPFLICRLGRKGHNLPWGLAQRLQTQVTVCDKPTGGAPSLSVSFSADLPLPTATVGSRVFSQRTAMQHLLSSDNAGGGSGRRAAPETAGSP